MSKCSLKRLSIALLILNLANPVYLQEENYFTNVETDLFSDKISPQNLNPVVTDKGTCSGECVVYYLCKKDGKIITDGAGIFDVRIKGSCPTENEICCGEEEGEEVVSRDSNDNSQGVSCGHRSSESNARISEGNESVFGEYPWMIAVMTFKDIEQGGVRKTAKVYQCGGALIHPKVVMTSAHCIATLVHNSTFFVLAGEWDAQTTTERLPHQQRNVESYVIHPGYHKGPLFNNIALLFLDFPVQLAEHISTICLPKQKFLSDSSNCYVSGWGKDKFGKQGVVSTILKSIKLPMVDRDECQAALRSTRLGKHFELHESFVCAGGEVGKDSCNRDGGSPLICPVAGSPNRFYQSGIVAWGIGCGQENIPGVYVNVALFRNWIDEETGKKNLDISSYAI